jgi:hypothetical protein
LPKWPRMSRADFDLLMSRIKGRLDKLAPRFVKAQTASRVFRALGRFGLWFGQDRVLEYVRLTILADLVRRDQIEGWDLPDLAGKSADDARAVLAELANPAYTFRTPDGIARTTHLPRGFVADVLSQLQVDTDKPFLVWQGTVARQQVFTLGWRKPGRLRSLPLIRQAANLLEAPTID